MEPVATVYVEGTELIVAFETEGIERDITLDVKSEGHAAFARVVMSDPNFWLQFLNSLSTALNNHVESN